MGLRSTSRKRFGQRGVAMVELAIALPVLLLMMMATAEIGRAFLQYLTLTHSVRDGVRYAIRNAADGTTGNYSITADDLTAIRNLVVFGNEGGTGTARLHGFVVTDVTASLTGDRVSVLGTYTYQPIFPFIPTFGIMGDISNAMTLRSEVTMKAL